MLCNICVSVYVDAVDQSLGDEITYHEANARVTRQCLI